MVNKINEMGTIALETQKAVKNIRNIGNVTENCRKPELKFRSSFDSSSHFIDMLRNDNL